MQDAVVEGHRRQQAAVFELLEDGRGDGASGLYRGAACADTVSGAAGIGGFWRAGIPRGD
jgi:hypothetical protein